MSIKNRHGKSAAKLAAALCMLSSGASSAMGGNVPKLIRTTAPIRVNPVPESGTSTPFAMPENVGVPIQCRPQRKSALAPIPDDSIELGMLLNPQGFPSSNTQVRQTAGGIPRINHFVELHSDGLIDTTGKLSIARSAAVPQRTRSTRGEIQTNPLVVDAPPELRRFDVNDIPLVFPTVDHDYLVDGALVVREQPLPPQPVADLNEALDRLSLQSNAAPAIIGTARNGGFGMLAIDQIGDHLGKSSSDKPVIDYPPLGRFANDLVLPSDHPIGSSVSGTAGSFRERLGTMDTQGLIEERVPQLPPPAETAEIEAIARSLEVLGQGVASSTKSTPIKLARQQPITSRRDPKVSVAPEKVALEVETLLAENSEQPNASKQDQEVNAPKPSLVERFSGWSKRLTSGRKSSENTPVSTRLSKQQSEVPPAPVPRKRSGGILTQWLNKSR